MLVQLFNDKCGYLSRIQSLNIFIFIVFMNVFSVLQNSNYFIYAYWEILFFTLSFFKKNDRNGQKFIQPEIFKEILTFPIISFLKICFSPSDI